MAQTSAQKKAAAKSRAKQKARPKAAKAKTSQLQEQNAQLQMAMLNIRQMYDQAVMERSSLEQQLSQRDQIITAAAVSSGGEILLTRWALENVALGVYSGYDIQVDADEGTYLIVAEEVADEDDGDSEDE